MIHTLTTRIHIPSGRTRVSLIVAAIAATIVLGGIPAGSMAAPYQPHGSAQWNRFAKSTLRHEAQARHSASARASARIFSAHDAHARQNLHRFVHAVRAVASAHPERAAAAASNASAFQISWSDWPPGTKNEAGGIADTSKLDDPGYNFFAFNEGGAVIHRRTYAGSGLLGAYIQAANIDFNTAGDVGAGYWLGSYYDTSQHATDMVNDALGTLASEGAAHESCGVPQQPACQVFLFSWNDSNGENHTTLYAIFSEQNGVAEIAIDGFTSSVQSNTNVVTNDMSVLAGDGYSVLHSAVTGGTGNNPTPTPTATKQQGNPTPTPTSRPTATPTPTPTKPTVHFGPISSAPVRPKIGIGQTGLHVIDGNNERASKVVRIKEEAFFFAFYVEANAGTRIPYGNIQFMRNGHAIGRPAVLVRDRTQTGRPFFDLDLKFTNKSLIGKMKARFTLHLGRTTASKSLAFTIKG